MKNQYVGDVSDFHKYGLLRLLSGDGELRTGVCWMLTDNDTRSDGQFVSYLDAPNKWRHFAPDVFDHLALCVREPGGRDVERIAASEVLPNTLFFPKLLTSNGKERGSYFEEMEQELTTADLIFFDPDNGLEIKSCPFGRRQSNKFLFWRELTKTFAAGHSVLVYQHFPRVAREQFIQRIASEAARQTGAIDTLVFQTAHTFFLLLSQAKHKEHFARQAELIERTWKKQIWVERPVLISSVV